MAPSPSSRGGCALERVKICISQLSDEELQELWAWLPQAFMLKSRKVDDITSDNGTHSITGKREESRMCEAKEQISQSVAQIAADELSQAKDFVDQERAEAKMRISSQQSGESAVKEDVHFRTEDVELCKKTKLITPYGDGEWASVIAQCLGVESEVEVEIGTPNRSWADMSEEEDSLGVVEKQGEIQTSEGSTHAERSESDEQPPPAPPPFYVCRSAKEELKEESGWQCTFRMDWPQHESKQHTKGIEQRRGDILQGWHAEKPHANDMEQRRSDRWQKWHAERPLAGAKWNHDGVWQEWRAKKRGTGVAWPHDNSWYKWRAKAPEHDNGGFSLLVGKWWDSKGSCYTLTLDADRTSLSVHEAWYNGFQKVRHAQIKFGYCPDTKTTRIYWGAKQSFVLADELGDRSPDSIRWKSLGHCKDFVWTRDDKRWYETQSNTAY